MLAVPHINKILFKYRLSKIIMGTLWKKRIKYRVNEFRFRVNTLGTNLCLKVAILCLLVEK